jgi:hypothetical protein
VRCLMLPQGLGGGNMKRPRLVATGGASGP